jgi:hypothetical protein
MSGQDATLSVKEAKAQQERICSGSEHQGPKGQSEKQTELMKKQKHQG